MKLGKQDGVQESGLYIKCTVVFTTLSKAWMQIWVVSL